MLIVTMTLVPLDKFIQNRIYTEFRGGVLGVLGVPQPGAVAVELEGQSGQLSQL